jgi:hypothetical protein
MTDVEDLLIFKLREKGRGSQAEAKPSIAKETQAVAKETQAIAQPAPPAAEKVEAEPAAEERPVVEAPRAAKPIKAKRGAREEIEGAKGKFCVWHPWRSAYALCDYCNRPFCYEDTVELGRKYYCLEDVDKVSEKFTEELYTEYSGISFVAAALFMMAFIVFIYFASGQIAYIVSYVGQIGVPAFLSSINYSYDSALLGVAIMSLGLVASVLIFMQSSKGFVIGLVAGLAGTVMFSYQFLNSSTLYMAVVGAISLAALMLLAYSKISYQVPAQSVTERSVFSNSVSLEQPSVSTF